MIIKHIAPLLLLLLSACSPTIIREEPPTQPVHAATKSATPQSLVTQADIDYAENFAASILAEENWESEVTVHEDRVMHTWHQHGSSNLAYLDYRVYAQGYTQADLDYYYSEETFNEILYSHYDEIGKITECNADNLTLYEFTAIYMDTTYLVRDWVDTSNPKRIADFSIIFKQADQTEMDALSRALFSSLPKCP